MIRIVVIEDEPLARQHLIDLLDELPGLSVVAAAENGRLGLAAIAEHHPDAVFLDIEMPGIKGTELMHMLPEPRPSLVFVTAYPQHAIEAFAGGAAHYLLKPISRVGVAQAMSRIRPKDEPLQKEWLRLPVRKKGSTRLLRPEEVEALVADLGDCMAWTPEGRLPVDGTLALGFGEHLHPRFHTKTMQSGLLITAPGSAPVAAVADGRVVFADYYQSYGAMVILDHGGGWFTLYTHLMGIQVTKAQVLKVGESVGAVGDTVDGPRLGFEIRHQAQPQDPQKWLKKRYR